MTAAEQGVSAGMDLEDAMQEFYRSRIALYARRDAAIQTAARYLPQKEIAQITELSTETIRQITKGYPVSWRRQVTVRGLRANAARN